MTKSYLHPVTVVATVIAVICAFLSSTAHALGSGSTLAISYGSGSGIVCAIVSGQQIQNVVCYDQQGLITYVDPTTSFYSIAAGENTLCGIRSGGYSLICWETVGANKFKAKRIYNSNTVLLTSLSVGDSQVCATVNGTLEVKCVRGSNPNDPGNTRFKSLSSGFGFSCGISVNSNRIRCWGEDDRIASRIQNGFGNMSMSSLVAGGSHVCGRNFSGYLICKGNNESGQLNIPSNSAMEYSGLALGSKTTCAIRQSNGSVICWGADSESYRSSTDGISFESIVSGSNFTCGLTTSNFSIICWGSGWGNSSSSSSPPSFPEILPGPCVESNCTECGVYPASSRLCVTPRNICKPCLNLIPDTLPPASPVSPPPFEPPPSSRSKGLTKGLLAFAIIGSVGAFSGFCTIVYCLWTGVCFGKKKVHNSVQPTITRDGSNGGTNTSSSRSPPSRSSTIRRQGSKMLSMRRQRSGTSSKHPDRSEEFSLAELAAATNDFSLENKIGAGSFGVVYRGKLQDGNQVAIKRGETGTKTKKFQEKETAFDSELAFLSRVHHKHLVRLVGYCEENEERLLVYEFMKNGALYNHLHTNNNTEKKHSPINSWNIRIKIALDASRGIEYLHNYAVPPIIHRDIKSSNILLDAHWTARVSDFGLSLMGPEKNHDYRPVKAAGTIGYIDPEYYGLNVLTTKSDVYGLGVVLLELLTGRRAIFKDNEQNEGVPISVVDYAVPKIMAGELAKVLDMRVGPPQINEIEAVELVAYTAIHCVNLEGKDRPTMTDIVANLERALAICGDDSHGSISSGSIEISLE